MSNITRAEIQAQIKALQAKLEAMSERDLLPVGAEIYTKGFVRQVDADDEQMPYRIDIEGTFIWRLAGDVIPAADLIPRAEHERALADAQGDAQDAAIRLIDLSRDYGGVVVVAEHPTDGHTYRVTVERVDDKSAEDAPVGCPQPKINAADAVAYLVKEYDTDTGHQDNAEPRTYRHTLRRHYKVTVHRAGDAVAVAPKSVVEELRKSINYLRSATVGSEGCENVCDKASTAFAQITELPEPSEWAQDIAKTHHWFKNGSGLNFNTSEVCLDVAAALIERAALLAQEAGDD